MKLYSFYDRISVFIFLETTEMIKYQDKRILTIWKHKYEPPFRIRRVSRHGKRISRYNKMYVRFCRHCALQETRRENTFYIFRDHVCYISQVSITSFYTEQVIWKSIDKKRKAFRFQLPGTIPRDRTENVNASKLCSNLVLFFAE